MDSNDPDFTKPICRVCLENCGGQEMSSILDVDLDEIFIYEKMEQCAGIEVLRDENLPTIICDNCYGLLKIAYDFRITCRNSEELLKKVLATKTIITDIEQPVEKNPLLIEESPATKKGTRSKPKKKNVPTPIPEPIKEESISPDSPITLEEFISESFEDYADHVESFDINCHNDEENNIHSDEDNKAFIKEINLDITVKTEKPQRIKKTIKRKKNPNLKEKKSRKSRSKVCKDENDDEIMNGKTPRPKKEKKEKSPHICEICGNKFPHKYTLKNHIKRHLNEKSFNCEICGYSCHSNMELVRHLRRHTGSKPFKCKYCTRAFGDNSTLIKHERVHRNERPYKCEICGSSFSYPAVLKRHNLVHTGEKPYKCEICGKCFNDRYHLISHLKTIQHKTDPRVESLLLNIRENNV